MTALNNENPVSAQRFPRGLAMIGSARLQGLVSFEVNNNSHYEADTFRLVLALSAQPANLNFQYWAAQIAIQIGLYAGFPPDPNNFSSSDLKQLILGNVDSVEIDPVADEIVLSGRDLTALFIDTKTTDAFMNLTSSGIALQLAARHGMATKVTATANKVGGYYKDDFLRVNKERSEWDLLTTMAREEGFLVYVTGNTLNFVPKPLPSTGSPYLIKWQNPTIAGYNQFNGCRIQFSRNLTVAKGITVVVRTHNIKTGKTLVATYPTGAKTIKPGQSTGPQIYNVRIANGTQASALLEAQRVHKEITQHEIKVHVEMPADNLLTAETMLQVTGTGTVYDQYYYPSAVVRSFSVDEGYFMRIEAKNHSPLTESSP